MDATYSQHLSRLSKMLLAGTGVAFAWLLLSFALGAAQAHAAEDDGLLGVVGSVVDGASDVVAGTAGAATDLVGDTTATVGGVLAPVAEEVAVIAPVVPVAPVLDIVDSAAGVVEDLTAGGVVTPIVEPVLDLVATVPVVGGLVSAVGLDDAVTTGGAAVDGLLQGTTAGVGGVVAGVSDSVGGAGDSVITPSLPQLPGLGGEAADVAVTHAAASVPALAPAVLARAGLMTATAAWFSLATAAFSPADPPPATFADDGAVPTMLHLLGAALQADSVLAGPGGAGPGAWVLVALVLVVAHRAWVRRNGIERDVAPAAPVLATDVSPD